MVGSLPRRAGRTRHADLADEVIANPHDPPGGITRYETRMRPGSRPIERDSPEIHKLILFPTALDDMVRFFTPNRHEEPAVNQVRAQF